jgi:aryl-alcohol dehydrogenase-like predicted oxidoreductase
LGKLVRESGRSVTVASKFYPFPWRFTRGSLMHALEHSLRHLGMESVDLYQIHFPTPPVPIETILARLGDAFDRKLIRAAGISNFNLKQTRRAHATLAARGIPPASNQVSFSLLDRRPETSGLLEACRDLNVTLIACPPLAQGLLTGKYTRQSPARRNARPARLPGVVQDHRPPSRSDARDRDWPRWEDPRAVCLELGDL